MEVGMGGIPSTGSGFIRTSTLWCLFRIVSKFYIPSTPCDWMASSKCHWTGRRAGDERDCASKINTNLICDTVSQTEVIMKNVYCLLISSDQPRLIEHCFNNRKLSVPMLSRYMKWRLKMMNMYTIISDRGDVQWDEDEGDRVGERGWVLLYSSYWVNAHIHISTDDGNSQLK